MKTYKGKVQTMNLWDAGCHVTIMTFERDVPTVTFVVEGEPLIGKVSDVTHAQAEANFTINGNRLVRVENA